MRVGRSKTHHFEIAEKYFFKTGSGQLFIYIHMWAGAKGGREERTTKNICCVGLAFIVCIVSVWVCDDLGQCFPEFKFVRGWFWQM